MSTANKIAMNTIGTLRMGFLPFPVVDSDFDRDRPTKIFLRKGTFGPIPNAGTYDKI